MSNSTALGQHPLAGLVVAVVGAGRIGSEVIRNLGLMGIGRIDVYERERHAADPLRSRYTVHEGDFWDTLTLARLQGYDFAVNTIDTRAASRRMNQKCLLANVNLIEVATENTLARVSAYPFGSRDDVGCAECGSSGTAAVSLPLASLRMSVDDNPCKTATVLAADVAITSAAGAVATALMARIAAGSHGSVARTATLDATLGQGTSIEIRRDPHCPRCANLQRPVPIVHTRNRWDVAAGVAAACPDVFNQRLELSDDIAGMAHGSCCLHELSARFHGGPIPAKFALTEVDGRTICLSFEDFGLGEAPASARAAAGRHPSN